jgi:hypothetical protein
MVAADRCIFFSAMLVTYYGRLVYQKVPLVFMTSDQRQPNFAVPSPQMYFCSLLRGLFLVQVRGLSYYLYGKPPTPTNAMCCYHMRTTALLTPAAFAHCLYV